MQEDAALDLKDRDTEKETGKPMPDGLSRRTFWGVGSAGLATAALTTLKLSAQSRTNIQKGESDHSADDPGPENKEAVGRRAVQSAPQYTFKKKSMAPTARTPGGEVRVVDSSIFLTAKNICGVLITLKPGGMREMHWHPHASEWQYYITGKARMTVFTTAGARTMDFRANDVGFVPRIAGHYIENTGDTDVNVLEVFAVGRFSDVSLNRWLRHLPPEMVRAHLNLDRSNLDKISGELLEVMPGPLLPSTQPAK